MCPEWETAMFKMPQTNLKRKKKTTEQVSFPSFKNKHRSVQKPICVLITINSTLLSAEFTIPVSRAARCTPAIEHMLSTETKKKRTSKKMLYE